MLAYLMLFAALFNAVCLYNAFIIFLLLIFANVIVNVNVVIMLCLGLLTHSSFISGMIFHHAQCFYCWFFLILCSHHFLYERAMCSLEK